MLSGWSESDRVSLLLETASGLSSAEERRDFLEAACAGEPKLADELEEALTIAAGEGPAEGEATAEPVAAGQVVAGRFHIVRRLGSGGMAVVYEAVDNKLMERRALKFPRRRHSVRFPEEVRAALRITHENICRIHEIHSTPESDFVSMELLEGETLLERMRRRPLTRAETLDVARQLCRGVEAAHAAGILHQDLKPENVMLTARAGGGARVVITDFGLAGPLGAAAAGKVAGTPNYIAPEVWKGGAPTPASDVYALGVILYEMLAGRLPFAAGSAWKERLNARPAAPGGGRWDRIVLRCLSPDPARRYGSAGEVLAAIERAFAPVYRRRAAIAAAAALLVAAPVFLFRDRIWPPPVARLAILPLAGSTGDAGVDAAARGAVYDVARQLESLGAKSQRLLVIPAQTSARYEVAAAGAAAQRLGATHVLSASVAPGAAGFRLRAGVTEAASGMTLRELEAEFAPTDASALAASLAGVVTSAFRMEKAPAGEIAAAAYGAYAAGVAALEGAPPDPGKAIANFREAVKVDGRSPVIYAKLADAYLTEYTAGKKSSSLDAAREAARRAESLQPDLPAALLAAGWVEQEEGRTDRAMELFRRAAAQEPKNPEAWRRTGLAMQRAGRDQEAIEALQQAARLAPTYFTPRESLGAAYYRVGRYAEAVEEFRAVTRLAPTLPNGYSSLGATLVAMGRDAEAEAAFRKAIEIRETRAGLNNLGVLLRFEGRAGEAAAVFERALRAGADDAGLRLNLGNALRAAGEAGRAQRHFREAASLARGALLVNPSDAAARARLAYALVRLRQTGMAGDEAQQAARAAPSDPAVIFWSAMTLEALGRRAAALAVVAGAPRERLQDLRRQPDLADLVSDPRFAELAARADRRETNPERKK